MTDWEKQLKRPFRPEEIEWREARNGVKDDKPYVVVLAYITSRAVMDRLDEVFGVDGWRAEFDFRPVMHNGKQETAVICTITAQAPTGEGIIIKQDGAPLTNYEAIKGGISDAFKRAAVQLGVGRYLYRLPEYFIWLQSQRGEGDGWHHTTVRNREGKQIASGWWREPQLPAWALPDGANEQSPKSQPAKTKYTEAQFGLVCKLIAEIAPEYVNHNLESHTVHQLATTLLADADKNKASKVITRLKEVKEALATPQEKLTAEQEKHMGDFGEWLMGELGKMENSSHTPWHDELPDKK